jgi:hypothetical protein
MMSIDSKLCPIIQFLFDDGTHIFRHQAERIAREINHRLAVFAERQMKSIAKIAKRVLGIDLPSEIFVSGEGESHNDTESFATDEHGSNTDRRFPGFTPQKISVNLCSSVAVSSG